MLNFTYVTPSWVYNLHVSKLALRVVRNIMISHTCVVRDTQDRQSACDVTLRCVRATVVTVEKQ